MWSWGSEATWRSRPTWPRDVQGSLTSCTRRMLAQVLPTESVHGSPGMWPSAPRPLWTRYRTLGLEANRPTLLVFGGSQGARTINEAVSGASRHLLDLGVQVLHAAGPGNP